MYSLNNFQLESNSKIKINFDGGDLSSDSGLLLIKEFTEKIGFHKIIRDKFKTTDPSIREHKDHENLLQVIYQVLARYFNDNDADELTDEPVLNAILDKDALASQPTLSRFFNRMDDKTLEQFNEILVTLRKYIYSLNNPKRVLLDLDSTLLKTYGKQEGEDFNFHYQARGYHPLMCFDGLTGDLLKASLRNGSAYSSTGVVDFMKSLLDEYFSDYPETDLYLRGDSGFATPDLFKQCERGRVSYAIRLKANQNLYKLSGSATESLDELTRDNKLDYKLVYDEFYYQAASWDYPRRVVIKIEKPRDQFTYQYTFIVTNMSLSPFQTIKFYANRGSMENFIKECKLGFNFNSTSSRGMIVNENRLQLRILAYNLFNWFRRLVLPKSMNKMLIDTIRLKLIKIASKVIHSGRYLVFKLSSSCPYKKEFFETFESIRKMPQLE